MKTVFLCGPYNTGNREENIKIAIKAAQNLRDKGYNVFCPHIAIGEYCTDMNDENKAEHKKIMKMCAQWIEICDAFAVIPGWEDSQNCSIEYECACALNKEIIYLTFKEIGI